MYHDIEISNVNKIWCRFDGKCWGECKSEYQDWSGFCSDKLNKLSVFSVECSLNLLVGGSYQRALYELNVAPLRVYVKFSGFPDDYEIYSEGSAEVSFIRGDGRYEYESGSFPLYSDDILSDIRKSLDTEYVTQYIDDEVKYHLGINDDKKLATKICDILAEKIVSAFHN